MVKKQAEKTEAPEGDEGVVLEYTPPPPPPKDDGPTKINLRFWDKLKDVTDTTALKGFTKGGGFTGTDINPTWRMERMTEVFGPVGWGWGYEVTNRRTEMMKAKKGDVQVVFVTVRCWYVPVGEEPAWPKTDGVTDRRNPPLNALWTGEQDGGTEVSLAPDEVYKQAITDGFGKTSAQVGLASAIYRGKWDDSKYKEDQERFSLMEGVKKYLEVLVPELEEMTDTRELRGLRNRASFIANQRTAHEVNFKLGNEFDAIVKDHENRVARALWERLHEVLKIEDLEVLSAEIDILAPQISALPDDRDIDEIRRLVKERKAALKKAMEPKEEPSDPALTKQESEPQLDNSQGFPLTLEVPEKNGNPQWGTFTKHVLEVITRAVEERPKKGALFSFFEANAPAFNMMIAAGGQYKTYYDRIEGDYKAAMEMLED